MSGKMTVAKVGIRYFSASGISDAEAAHVSSHIAWVRMIVT